MDTNLDNQRKPDSNRNSWIAEKINLLTPEKTPSSQSARAKFDSRIQAGEMTIWQTLWKPNIRNAWITLLAAAILVLSLSIPQVRVIANSFLGLFRVERIEAVDVGISLSTLPQEMERNFEVIDDLVKDQLIIDKVVQPIEANSISEAGRMAGIKAREPVSLEAVKRIFYQEATTVRLIIDQSQWQALLNTLGYGDFIIPKSTDGEEVIFNIPSGVIVGIGDCLYNEIDEVKLGHPGTENCTVFLQSSSPTIEAPSGVDINKAGQILLQALGMSPTEAEQFSTTVNWATTLIVPVPSDMKYRQVKIEGVDGIYLEEETYPDETPVYTLLWLKDGILNALIGDGYLADAMNVVESLE